jgi:hypothetical protein
MPRGKRIRALQLVTLKLRRLLARALQEFRRAPEQLLEQVEAKLASPPPSAGLSTERKPEMADDKTNRGEPDRSRINMSEDYEVKYWMERLGTTREEQQKAIDRVGNSANAVAKEFGQVA